jgi:transcriptional regulator with XRE-family HTH domain
MEWSAGMGLSKTAKTRRTTKTAPAEPVQNGPATTGPTQNGPTQNGPAPSGPALVGPAQIGTLQKRASSARIDNFFRLGEHVHRIRLDRGLTLEQVGRRSCLAPSTISKIENEQMSPTFEALQKLAAGLDIDMDELLTGPQRAAPSGRRSITRAGQGQFHASSTYAHEFLCTELTHKPIVPSKARIHARSVTDFPDWVRHEGDDFLLVLEGSVELHTEFYEAVTLETGDSIYYDAGMGHICISVSPQDALVLWVPVRCPKMPQGQRG